MVDVPGVTGPVATLETEFETDLLEFDRAIRFLDPKNWPGCSSFWCAMDDRGLQPSGVRRYHEQVSIDCDHKDAAWTIEAELDFKFRRLQAPHVAITEYELSDGGLPQRDVLVDEGSLVVRELAPKHLRVTTTKRVMFNHAFSGEALALIMCALGYAYIVEDLVFTCARGGAEGTPFPEHRGAAGKPGASTVGPVIAQTATALKACIDDCADAAQSSARRIEEGSYTADSLVQDMATTWVRMLREGATGLEAGIRSAQAAAARSRSREPPPD